MAVHHRHAKIVDFVRKCSTSFEYAEVRALRNGGDAEEDLCEVSRDTCDDRK